ncbi:hypothetical protein RM555_13265 [Micromonospora sp. DSM 115977]|uniref:MYXO-CTERM domain-containing protein n=1 Tax=Micromonospora reichwaldensis TaxID=3075516 RepID=A0ABU2WWR1_9ACTN|nr:hypothetical protein [Micromonospora sp. DSM 115977]MDT0529958.1 hypothetical protein [Micromonospora sp. DSM 115977]
MANKMLGKVVAGAALGGASLLVFTPGIAFADGHHDDEGKVYAKPHVVRAGETVKLLEVCPDRQEHAFVWSKVTGKVKLKPAEGRNDWRSGEEDSRDHDKGRDHEDKGRDHDKGDHDKGGHGKDDNGKGETPKPQPSATATATGQPKPPTNGQGGGAADAGAEGERDWKGYEHGQDAEGDREGRDKGHDKSDREGREDRKDHDGYGSDSNGSDEYDRKGHDSGWSDEESEGNGNGKDEDRWEHKRDFIYYGEAEVSEDAKPGRYELKGSCGEGELVVLPRGGVDGGDGGVGAGTDRGLAAGGASLIGAAALGGLVLMRRRRTDESFV